MTRTQWHITWLVIWCTAVTAALYHTTLALPFFFDDLDHFPYVASHTLPYLWQNTGGFPYYRPFPGTLWWLSYHLLGSHSPLLHHSLNVLLHATNGLLVGLVAWQLAPTRRATPFLSATLFLTYPFSYQGVAWVGAVYHLWATFFVLFSLFAYGRYQATQRRAWLAVGLTAVLLAPFAHENGLIAPLLITLYALFNRTSWRSLWRVGVWFAPLGVWAAVWRMVTTTAATTADTALNNAETLGQNTAYFAQGVGYPLTWLGGWLRDDWGWNDLQTAVWLSVLALATAALLLWWHRAAWRTAVLGAACFILASLPAVLLLDFAYVISSPRLLMMPSAGIALLWGGILGEVWQKRGRVAQTAVALLLAIWLGQNGLFIQRHTGQHTLLGRAWWQAVELATAANRAGQTPIFINLPTSLTTPTATYPLGHEGTVFMVPYIFPERILSVNAGQPITAVLHRYDDIRPTMPYFYDVLGGGQDWATTLTTTSNATVYSAHYTADSIHFVPVGGLQASPSTTPAWQMASGDLQLLSSQFTLVDELTGRLDLVWETAAPLPWELTIFAHAVDSTGQLVAQADGQAWDNTLPLGQWPPHTRITDTRTIVFPAPPTAVQVFIGLYNWQTGERLPLALPDGTAVPPEGFLIPTR